MLTSSMLLSFMPWQCASIQVTYTTVPGVDIYFLATKKLKAAFNLHITSEREVAALLRDRL